MRNSTPYFLQAWWFSSSIRAPSRCLHYPDGGKGSESGCLSSDAEGNTQNNEKQWRVGKEGMRHNNRMRQERRNC